MNPLCVIIPSRSASNLVACVRAVRKHEPDVQIIVVDDGLPPLALEGDRFEGIDEALLLGRTSDEIHLGRKPFVFARNVNIGLRAAGEADCVLLNDDALLESHGGFTLLQQAAQQHPDFGVIGAVTDLTGQPLQRPRKRQCPKCFAQDSRFKYDNGANYVAWGCNACGHEFHSNPLREVEHIAFVCCLLPQKTRERLRWATENPFTFSPSGQPVLTGGFLDERYCVGYGSDDLDACMQVRHIGLKVGVHDGCFVNHSSLQSSFRGDPTAPGYIWANHRILRKKWGMPPNPDDPEARAKR